MKLKLEKTPGGFDTFVGKGFEIAVVPFKGIAVPDRLQCVVIVHLPPIDTSRPKRVQVVGYFTINKEAYTKARAEKKGCQFIASFSSVIMMVLTDTRECINAAVNAIAADILS